MASILDPIGPYITNFSFNDDPPVARNQTISGYFNAIRSGPRIWNFTIQYFQGANKWIKGSNLPTDNLTPNLDYALFNNIRAQNRLGTWLMKFDAFPVSIRNALNYKGSMTASELSALTVNIPNVGKRNTITIGNLPLNRTNAIPAGTILQLVLNGKYTQPITVATTLSTSSSSTVDVVLLDFINLNTTGAVGIKFGTDVGWFVKFVEINSFGLNNLPNGIVYGDITLREDLAYYTL